MAYSYWKSVRKSAFSRTSAAFGINSMARLILGLFISVVIVGVLLFWGNDGSAQDELLVRGALVIIVIAVFPLVFVWHFVREPPERDEQLKREISVLNERKSDAIKLGDLADEISQFLNNFVSNRPGGERDLSFVGKHQRNNPGIIAEGDSTIITDDDDDICRMMMLKQDERRRYDQSKITEFIMHYSGRISAAVELISSREGGLSIRQRRVVLKVHALLRKTDYYYFERKIFDMLVAELNMAAERNLNDKPQTGSSKG